MLRVIIKIVYAPAFALVSLVAGISALDLPLRLGMNLVVPLVVPTRPRPTAAGPVYMVNTLEPTALSTSLSVLGFITILLLWKRYRSVGSSFFAELEPLIERPWILWPAMVLISVLHLALLCWLLFVGLFVQVSSNDSHFLGVPLIAALPLYYCSVFWIEVSVWLLNHKFPNEHRSEVTGNGD